VSASSLASAVSVASVSMSLARNVAAIAASLLSGPAALVSSSSVISPVPGSATRWARVAVPAGFGRPTGMAGFRIDGGDHPVLSHPTCDLPPSTGTVRPVGGGSTSCPTTNASNATASD
jgi:hypothetical protein